MVTGATVTVVRLAGDKCTGLEYRGESGELISVTAGQEVTLTAGAVGSATLLMLSGIGPEDQLRATGIPAGPHV